MSTEGGSSPVFNLNQRKYSHQKAFVVVRLRAFKRHCAGLRSSPRDIWCKPSDIFFWSRRMCIVWSARWTAISICRSEFKVYVTADSDTHARNAVVGVACTWATISASSPSSTSRSPSVSSVVVASSRLHMLRSLCSHESQPSLSTFVRCDVRCTGLFRQSSRLSHRHTPRLSVFLKQFRATYLVLVKFGFSALSFPRFFGVYYRKRGSASYIVREVLSVREREREIQRERERERKTEVTSPLSR